MALAALRLFEHRGLVIWLPTYCSVHNPIKIVTSRIKPVPTISRITLLVSWYSLNVPRPTRTCPIMKTAFTFRKTYDALLNAFILAQIFVGLVY
jgi:hypothetical protein